MSVEATRAELVFCVCGSHRVEYDPEAEAWGCGDCGSTITQEGVDRLAAGAADPQGPLELLP